MKFREAVETDLDSVQRLMNGLYDEDPNVHGLRPDVHLTYLEFLNHPDKGRLIAFEKDGMVAGYAIIVFFWSNEYGSNLVEIDELFVDGHFRGGGLGTKFFSWLQVTFGSVSAGWTLQVARSNSAAIKLYDSLGFKNSRNQHMICEFQELAKLQ